MMDKIAMLETQVLLMRGRIQELEQNKNIDELEEVNNLQN